MSLDLSKISSRAILKYVEAGERFSSAHTLAQANKTLGALERYSDLLADHGFPARDIEKLKGARDEVRATTTGHQQAALSNKTTSKDYVDSVLEGKQVREQGRSVLSGAIVDLTERDTEGDAQAANGITSTLEKTRSAGDSAVLLSEQLRLLCDKLDEEGIASMAADRNGAAVVARLKASIDRLDGISEALNRSGSSAQQERLDLLDGIIIDLSRRARRAARSAAKAHGKPAVAEAFNLSALYGN